MSEPSEDKLARLKREYLAAKQVLDFKNIIADKRDLLENSIQELKKDIENGTFNFYRQKDSGKEDLKELSETIENNTELLKSVTKTRRELDAKLDEFELFSAEMLFHLKEGVVEAILEIHPEKKSEYESLINLTQEKQYLFEYSKEIETSVYQVVELLGVISQERSSVKKSGIFRYLFGANPNFTISNSLKSIGSLTSATLPLLEELTEHSAFQGHTESLLKECTQIFEHLQNQTKDRWGWGKIDNEIIPYHNQLIVMKENIKRMTTDLEIETNELRSQIDEWIVTNS